MANHPLFAQSKGWDLNGIPSRFDGVKTRTKDPNNFSSFHPVAKATASVHRYVLNALLAYCLGDSSEIATINVGNETFATEYKFSNGETMLFVLYPNGTCKGAMVGEAGNYAPILTFAGKSDVLDLTPIMMAVLMKLCSISGEVDDMIRLCKGSGVDDRAAYLTSDAVYFAVTTNALRVSMPGGSIDLLPKQTVESGALSGTVICGTPKLLRGTASKQTAGMPTTFGDAMKEFTEWRKDTSWTPEERQLIPSFPDDYPVLPEALKICRRYVSTHEDKQPMLNFMWRGITSYGKSTGVEQIAAMLDMPLLRMTCSSTMETEDFLSNIIPVSAPEAETKDLPSFDEMAFDPESAYLTLTGIEKPDATSEECLAAYAKAYSAQSGQKGSLFKQVEANFVKALEKGYLLEIQECSRIKDPGVLVGLNEYDRPGAIIPLVDGGHVRRHKDAIVIYTDNVGYASCRPMDPSVLRRMSFILDSNEIPKETAMARVRYNTGFQKDTLLEKMYSVWREVQNFCQDHDITEGSISLTELERWAQCVMADGYDNLMENCEICVVSKATSVPEEQEEIKSSVLAVHLT